MCIIAVVPARNESSSIANVLRQLRRGQVDGCVVVCNGSTDCTESIARAHGSRLFSSFECVAVEEPLGPDVPRAVGVYYALRRFPQASSILCIDGDCAGGFGPALAAFVRAARQHGSHIVWPADPGEPGRPKYDEQLWNRWLGMTRPDLVGIQPASCPLWVHRSAFSILSPGTLSHPGLWLAKAIHCGLRLGTEPFDGRILGNPTRSRSHTDRMRETLIGDAVEGIRLLAMQRPGRVWNGRDYQGYDPLRRTDLLMQVASCCQVLV